TKASRLHVIATIHGDGADYVRGLGADEVIDTTSEEFQAQDFVNFTRRADAVIDTVGGKTQDQLFSLVKPGGIIVSAGVRPDTPTLGVPTRCSPAARIAAERSCSTLIHGSRDCWESSGVDDGGARVDLSFEAAAGFVD